MFIFFALLKIIEKYHFSYYLTIWVEREIIVPFNEEPKLNFRALLCCSTSRGSKFWFCLQVQVLWATDPLAQWRDWVGVAANKDKGPSSSAKLVQPEVPLSRHGKGNKLELAIVNTRSTDMVLQCQKCLLKVEKLLPIMICLLELEKRVEVMVMI